MPPKVCDFYSKPGGCRRGTQCNFRHVDNGANNEGSQQGSQPSHSRSRQGSAVRPVPAGPPPPRGVCNSYWASGQCTRGFACRFRHESQSAASGSGGQGRSLPRPSASSRAVDALAPFLTEKGLSRITGTGSDIYFASPTSKTLTPPEAHNALKTYLHKDYQFSKTFYIYGFLKPISSASSGNESWVNIIYKRPDRCCTDMLST